MFNSFLEQMYNPLEQFKVYSIINLKLLGIDLTLTNTSLYLILSFLIYLFIYKISNTNNIIPNNIRLIIMKIYKLLLNQFMEILTLKGNIYFSFIYTLFVFIVLNNLIGLIPYSFTTTSQFIITLTMSLTIIIGITLLGIKKYKFKFINLFIPKGLPKAILPVIFIIEIISYLSRIISLSVRLSANMIAGHTIINIIASSIGNTIKLKYLIVILPLFFIIILELGVSLIQGFVFSVLTATYIKDILESH